VISTTLTRNERNTVPDDFNTGGHPRKDDEHGAPGPKAVVWPSDDPGYTTPPVDAVPQSYAATVASDMPAQSPNLAGVVDLARGWWKRRYVRILAGAVAVALVGAGVSAFAYQDDGCSGDEAVTVNVSVAPEIEPAMAKAVGRFNDSRQVIGGRDGKCVRAQVQGDHPAQMTTLLGQGSAIGTTSRPDVWIPDSSLWAALLQSMSQDKRAVEITKTSVARSQIVVGISQTFAEELRSRGVTAGRPSWNSLLRAGSGLDATVKDEEVIPPNLLKLEIPDPTRNAAGLGSLTLVHQLWAGDPDERTRFTGMVRSLRESTIPDTASGFATFERDEQGRWPVIIASEQAVFAHNQSKPKNPALAVYPPDAALAMDYPYTITTDDTEKVKAARMLAAEMRTEETAEDVRALGFRSADGQVPASFGPQFGVSQQAMPEPEPADVQRAIEVWYTLSKGIRNVTLVDVSSSTNEKVLGLTRLQATVRAGENLMALMSDDTEMGLWIFGTALQGGDDWRELVPLGRLSDQTDQGTHRQQILSAAAKLEPQAGPGPGLYDSVLAAFRMMNRTYDPNVVNSLLVFTNGNNNDPSGTSLPDLLTALGNEYNPAKPVQIIMIGFGGNVAREGLQQIADATRGNVYVVQAPEQIQDVVLDAISRRTCAAGSSSRH
jgi:Bacterial extracellular solute-binding protein/von Willebrand factor type A domain